MNDFLGKKYFYAKLRGLYKTISLTIFVLFSMPAFAADIYVLHADEWRVPKSSATLLEMPAVFKSMQMLQGNFKAHLLIKYPGGDEGTLWVNELRSWLVALGLSSKRIELAQGSATSASIEFEVLSKLNSNHKISFNNE